MRRSSSYNVVNSRSRASGSPISAAWMISTSSVFGIDESLGANPRNDYPRRNRHSLGNHRLPAEPVIDGGGARDAGGWPDPSCKRDSAHRRINTHAHFLLATPQPLPGLRLP